MDVFNQISCIINPATAWQFVIRLRIQQLEADLQLHLCAMNDIEVEIQQLKTQLNDPAKIPAHRGDTIVSDDDVCVAAFV